MQLEAEFQEKSHKKLQTDTRCLLNFQLADVVGRPKSEIMNYSINQAGWKIKRNQKICIRFKIGSKVMAFSFRIFEKFLPVTDGVFHRSFEVVFFFHWLNKDKDGESACEFDKLLEGQRQRCNNNNIEMMAKYMINVKF